MVIAEELRGEIQLYDYSQQCWAKIADISSDGDSGKPRNILGASTRQQCCADGAFEFGGVYAATMSMTVRLPGLTRYQLKGARVLFQTRFDGGDWIDRGTFYVTDVQRTADVFTLSGQDAMGWCDTSSFYTTDDTNFGFGDFLLANTGGVAASLQWWMMKCVETINRLISAKTRIPFPTSPVLGWVDYSKTDNGGIDYCNASIYAWNEQDQEWEDTGAPAYYSVYQDDGVYHDDNPRDFLRWLGTLAGGFITVRRSGELTLRQFCQPSLGTAVVTMADIDWEQNEVADFALALSKASVVYSDISFRAIGTITHDLSSDKVGFMIHEESNPFLDGFQGKAANSYSPVANLWLIIDRFSQVQNAFSDPFTIIPRPFRVRVHAGDVYELGQQIYFPDWHDLHETQTHAFYSVITGIAWTFRGGTVLSCGGEDERTMADCIRATKADKAIRELRSRFRA